MTRPTYLLAALALVAACSKKPEAPRTEAPTTPPPAAPAPAAEPTATIEVGRAIGPDKRVMAALEEFKARDTIYAAVASSNVPADQKLIATWTHESGQTVRVDSAESASQAEFHITKKTPWPKGKYKVAVTTSGGTALGEKELEVK